METSEGEWREEMEVERSLDVVDQEVPADSNQDNLTILLGQSLSPSVVRRLLLDETSKFNRSDRNGPNCATFYFKHLDTESEAEVAAVSEGGPKSTLDESSEEEWTYTVTQDSTTGTATLEVEEAALEAAMMASLGGLEDLPEDDKMRPRKEMIAKLVEKAEEMILEEVCASPARKRASRVFEPHRIIDPQTNTKYTRVKEWLQLHPESKVVGDSCDASGETTEEEGSVGSGSEHLDTTLQEESEPRVVLRHKRPSGPRPSSFSTPSALLPYSSCLPHSISESAIHQLTQSQSSGSGGRIDSSANNVSTLSSSTVEESTLTQDAGSAGGYSSNSLRRRKVKLRKRSLMRKSESYGSESVLGASDATLASPIKLPTLAKLAMRRASADKPSDSPARKLTVLSGNSSGSESESEGDGSTKHQKVSGVAPAFRLGPAHTLCAYASDRKDGKIAVSADSSFSETAWDNYQEKYMSEAYSEEAPDSEATRRILDFGDDYRAFLDSQSDCASSLGPPQLMFRKPARRQAHGGESDSELEDAWHLVRQSQSQLFFSEKVFNTQLSRASPHLVLASDFAELVSTCKDNISALTQMLEKIEEGTALLSSEECNDIRELISQWERLEKGAEELQRERSLKREMAALREELLEMASRSASLETDLEDRDQLELRIQEVKSELSRLRDVNKSQLFQVNLAVHRFLTDCPSSTSVLKDQVADLYRLWDDTFHRACGRLRSLEEAGAAWQQFDRHLAGLQAALRGDQEALSLLRAALARGPVPPDMASGLRDIARLLSEKAPNQKSLDGPDSNLENSDTAAVVRELCGSAEGSLSDSGISDSGSEQELSERERRLSALRRLVRHLEAVLAPNSQAIINMSKRLEATEHELRGLQQTCRDLIVKTAVCVEAKGRLPVFSPPSPDSKECPNPKKGGKGPRWLIRVIRAALPFHLALVALFCIACLLQPHCCDSLNNLNLSFTPQLRYLKGPPPI